MSVKIEHEKPIFPTVLFRDLKIGDVCEYAHFPCMVVPNLTNLCQPEKKVVINLSDGKIMPIHNDDSVIPIDVRIIWKYKIGKEQMK